MEGRRSHAIILLGQVRLDSDIPGRVWENERKEQPWEQPTQSRGEGSNI